MSRTEYERIDYRGKGWFATIRVAVTGSGWIFSTKAGCRTKGWNDPVGEASLPYMTREAAVKAAKATLYSRLIMEEKLPGEMRLDMLDKIGDPAQRELFAL